MFDVSDPASPTEVDFMEIGKQGTYSQALYNHHGITFRPAMDGQPARLAFSIDVADIADGFSQGDPTGWHSWRESGLHAFEINTGNNAGITDAGKMIVETTSAQNPWGPMYYDHRSRMVDDAVYYIHGGQVYSAKWNALESFNGPH